MNTGLRSFLLILLVLGLAGTGAELILLEHTEEFWQWSPVVLIGLALVLVVAIGVRPRRMVLRTFQGVMGVMVASAAIGLWQHYAGNAEFELEMYPSRAGWELFWESLKGATPTLAPGMMLHLGLLGLAYTFKHPALSRERPESGESL